MITPFWGTTSPSPALRPDLPQNGQNTHQLGWGLALGLIMVSLPVAVEAPLVRWCPALCLILSVGWLGVSNHLLNKFAAGSKLHWCGSLLWGFSLSWLAGAIYWGWLRSYPAWHLIVESLAVPWAIWGWQKPNYRVGAHFYLGSLFGTACTDGYFYLNGLLDIWAKMMSTNDPMPLLQQAIIQVNSVWGQTTLWAFMVIISVLVVKHLTRPTLPNWIFAGTLLGTIAVDLLFYYTSWASLNPHLV